MKLGTKDPSTRTHHLWFLNYHCCTHHHQHHHPYHYYYYHQVFCLMKDPSVWSANFALSLSSYRWLSLSVPSILCSLSFPTAKKDQYSSFLAIPFPVGLYYFFCPSSASNFKSLCTFIFYLSYCLCFRPIHNNRAPLQT